MFCEWEIGEIKQKECSRNGKKPLSNVSPSHFFTNLLNGHLWCHISSHLSCDLVFINLSLILHLYVLILQISFINLILIAWKKRCTSDETYIIYLRSILHPNYSMFLLDRPECSTTQSWLWARGLNWKKLDSCVQNDRKSWFCRLEMIYKFDTGTGRISISTVGHDWRHSDFGTNFRIKIFTHNLWIQCFPYFLRRGIRIPHLFFSCDAFIFFLFTTLNYENS